MATIYYSREQLNGHQYYLGVTEKGLAFVGSEDQERTELEAWYPTSLLVADSQKTQPYAQELTDYFTKKKVTFDLPKDIKGTIFQESVWQALAEIPYGTTTTYANIAASIGNPKAVRAVGTAIGKNPLLIVMPCHRVIGTNGQITGYRGGIPMKTELLALEKNNNQ